jgi:hypothetical protein
MSSDTIPDEKLKKMGEGFFTAEETSLLFNLVILMNSLCKGMMDDSLAAPLYAILAAIASVHFFLASQDKR